MTASGTLDPDLCAGCGSQFPAGQLCGACTPVTKQSVTFMVPQALLDDYAGLDVADVLARALRGEQVFNPLAATSAAPLPVLLARLAAARSRTVRPRMDDVR